MSLLYVATYAAAAAGCRCLCCGGLGGVSGATRYNHGNYQCAAPSGYLPSDVPQAVGIKTMDSCSEPATCNATTCIVAAFAEECETPAGLSPSRRLDTTFANCLAASSPPPPSPSPPSSPSPPPLPKPPPSEGNCKCECDGQEARLQVDSCDLCSKSCPACFGTSFGSSCSESHGAAIGIGAAAGIGAAILLSLVGCAFCFFNRRRAQQQQSEIQEALVVAAK
jgi:hypothetical protein